MHSGASGLARVDASFAVSAPRDHAYRLCSVLSIIAPSVNVLRRTRRKPSTIRGASPEVVIGQSAAAPAGARPYHSGGKPKGFRRRYTNKGWSLRLRFEANGKAPPVGRTRVRSSPMLLDARIHPEQKCSWPRSSSLLL